MDDRSEMMKILTRKDAAWFGVLLIVAVIGEFSIRFNLEVFAINTSMAVPVAVDYLWVSIPNFIWFTTLGACIWLLYRDRSWIWGGLLLLINTLLIWKLRYPEGIWVAPEWRAYLQAYLPLAAIPLGMIFGAVTARGIQGVHFL